MDNVEAQIHRYNGQPIGIVFPPHVELTVARTEMGVRGNTASGSVTKTAVLETGLEIQVPLFIKEGEKVKVHTETREFAGTSLDHDAGRRARRRRLIALGFCALTVAATWPLLDPRLQRRA